MEQGHFYQKYSGQVQFDRINIVETTEVYQSVELNHAILRESWGGVDRTEYRDQKLMQVNFMSEV